MKPRHLFVKFTPEEQMNSLNAKSWFGLIVVTIVMGLLLFIPAGTIRYWQAWLFLCVYFAASSLSTVYAMRNNPKLLQRRMSGGPLAEKEVAQKIIMSIVSVAFIACLVVPSLDIRFGWSRVPLHLVVTGDVLVALFFYVAYLALRENTFASSTIELANDHRVVSSGIYAFIRHPMYLGVLALFIGMPLALGSYWGLLSFPLALPALVWRLLDEERFLAQNLHGYAEYCAKVRWRLIPGVF
jgi:protein-S-isoprenylcysteine O-methyltransferase Ste14